MEGIDGEKFEWQMPGSSFYPFWMDEYWLMPFFNGLQESAEKHKETRLGT